MFFSPFANIKNIPDISKLKYSDLDILKSQVECYTVEYKSKYDSDFKEKKLPKAVCAFSNRNGGWLFVGINDKGIAVDVDLSAITQEALYSIIAARVQPMPHVTIAILENPEKIGFGVVALYVSEGKNTPFIANGIVYVRNGNVSIPADQSALDLLIKKGYDYSDISLKCLDANENEFVFARRQYGDKVFIDPTHLGFDGCIQYCKRIALYLQNDGNHFDENIELTIKIPRECYFDILANLKRNPNSQYEDLFNEYSALPATHEIVEYSSPRLFNGAAVPPASFGHGGREYELNYMEYLFENMYYDFQVIGEGEYVYIKIIFKEINPKQKMFLPAMLLCKNSLKSIEYTITSKYSMSLISGTLTKAAEG